MYRARFKTRSEDPRPVKWPIKYPYWISGMGSDDMGNYDIVIAYVDDEQQLLDLWPEAEDIDMEPDDKPSFSSRFPKPDWYEVEPPERDER